LAVNWGMGLRKWVNKKENLEDGWGIYQKTEKITLSFFDETN